MRRRAISREPVSRRRISGDFTRRAASVDPVRSRASPRDDFVFYNHDSPPLIAPKDTISGSDSSSADGLTASDEGTDIETETDEMYFESRKGWNGPAVEGAESKGFYADVVSDYKAIARDVEAETAQAEEVLGMGAGIKVINLVVNKRVKERQIPKANKIYGGPDLVPSQDELWG